MSWLQDPTLAVAGWPAFALPLLVFLSAFLEYVIPPIPGDSLMLLGFFMAGHGAAEPSLIFAMAFVGGSLGAACAFLLGRRYGNAWLDRLTLGRAAPLEQLRRLFGVFGEKVLALNRFLPFLRNFLLYAAGASAQRFGLSMAWTAVSNLLFVGLLAWLGAQAAASWNDLQHTFRNVIGILALVAVTMALVLAFVRWRSRRATPPTAAP